MRFVIISLLCVVTLCAQPKDSLKKFSVTEANTIINNIEGWKDHPDFFQAAIQTKRIDLVKTCFENPRTMYNAAKSIKTAEDASFRNQMITMMLESDSSYWPSEASTTAAASSTVYPITLRQPFMETILSYLPNISNVESLFNTKADRLSLAEKFRKAITGIEGPTTERPNKRPEQAVEDGASGSLSNSIKVKQAGCI